MKALSPLLLLSSVGAQFSAEAWVPGVPRPTSNEWHRQARETATSPAYSKSETVPTSMSSPRRAVLLSGLLYGLGIAQPVPAEQIGQESTTKDSSIDTMRFPSRETKIKSLDQQMKETVIFTTMNGVWKFDEYDNKGELFASGTLTFTGDPRGSKGKVEYRGDGQLIASGRGRWSLRADGFAKNPIGKGGVVRNSALWNLRRDESGVFAYFGLVKVDGFTRGRADAMVEGDIIKLVKGGNVNAVGGGYEKKVGTFTANLRRLLTEEENDASAAGPVQISSIGVAAPQPVIV